MTTASFSLLLALLPFTVAQGQSAGETQDAGETSSPTPVEGREWIVIVDIVILVSSPSHFHAIACRSRRLHADD